MKIHKNKSDYYQYMNYLKQSNNLQFEVYPFSECAQRLAFIKHDALLLMKFLRTETQVKIKKVNHYDLYCTTILI